MFGHAPRDADAARTVNARGCQTARAPRTVYPDDAELIGVLTSMQVPPEAYLGHGSESWVYALPGDRVVRVLHEGGSLAFVDRQRALLAELASAPMPFALPEMLDVGERFGRIFVIERRLAGSPGLRMLDEVAGKDRPALIQAHLAASARLGDLALHPRPFFGELLAREPIRASTWLEFLAHRADEGFARSGGRVPRVDPASLVAEFDDVADGRFVHLDAFLDNMLFLGTSVSAVLDIGVTTVVGDRRFDPVSAAVYVSAPTHTPNATAADADVAKDWLRQHGLDGLFAPVRRWLATFWAGALADPALVTWCRMVLEGP
jgi:Phosphotransferase enzyme family